MLKKLWPAICRKYIELKEGGMYEEIKKKNDCSIINFNH